MRNGKPHLLVVGAADTGRAPLLAALLRHALGDGIFVTSAGILAHSGEPADPNVGLALDQLGIGIPTHTARHLDRETAHDADAVVAIDHGTAHVAAMQLGRDVIAINHGPATEDVQDPHRMPLGIWIATLRSFETQIAETLPILRERLGMVASAPSRSTPAPAPEQPPPADAIPAPNPSARGEHIAHIVRLFATVEVLPEIVDWSRLVGETTARLRALADLAHGPDDYTLAAALIVIGLLSQTERTPPADQIKTLRGLVEHLAAPVGQPELVAMARIVGA